MDEGTLGQVREKVIFLEKTYNVRVTDQSVLILGECFTAILKDPHRSWPIRESKETPAIDIRALHYDMLNALPSTLASFAAEQRIKTITSFELLHSMSSIIDHMCPFVKPPP